MSQALLIALNSSLTLSSDERLFTQYACEDFIGACSLPATPSLSRSPPYKLSEDVDADEASWFADALLGLPHIRRIQLLHYLLRSHAAIPNASVQEGRTMASILTALLQRIQIFTLVLQKANPPPRFSLPAGTAFGRLTLADAPPSILCPEPTNELNTSDTAPSGPSPQPTLSTPSAPSPVRPQPCRFTAGRRRRGLKPLGVT